MRTKRPKTLYRYCLYDFEVKKCRVLVENMVEVVDEKEIPYFPRAQSVLYRVRDEDRKIDFPLYFRVFSGISSGAFIFTSMNSPHCSSWPVNLFMNLA